MSSKQSSSSSHQEYTADASPDTRTHAGQSNSDRAQRLMQRNQHPTDGVPARVPFRSEMEAMFGTHFGGVQALLGSDALASAGLLGLAAPGMVMFADERPSRETVAHELAHILQLTGAGSPGGPQDPEAQAEEAAQGVRRGDPTAARAVSARPASLSRPAARPGPPAPRPTAKSPVVLSLSQKIIAAAQVSPMGEKARAALAALLDRWAQMKPDLRTAVGDVVKKSIPALSGTLSAASRKPGTSEDDQRKRRAGWAAAFGVGLETNATKRQSQIEADGEFIEGMTAKLSIAPTAFPKVSPHGDSTGWRLAWHVSWGPSSAPYREFLGSQFKGTHKLAEDQTQVSLQWLLPGTHTVVLEAQKGSAVPEYHRMVVTIQPVTDLIERYLKTRSHDQVRKALPALSRVLQTASSSKNVSFSIPGYMGSGTRFLTDTVSRRILETMQAQAKEATTDKDLTSVLYESATYYAALSAQGQLGSYASQWQSLLPTLSQQLETRWRAAAGSTDPYALFALRKKISQFLKKNASQASRLQPLLVQIDTAMLRAVTAKRAALSGSTDKMSELLKLTQLIRKIAAQPDLASYQGALPGHTGPQSDDKGIRKQLAIEQRQQMSSQQFMSVFQTLVGDIAQHKTTQQKVGPLRAQVLQIATLRNTSTLNAEQRKQLNNKLSTLSKQLLQVATETQKTGTLRGLLAMQKIMLKYLPGDQSANIAANIQVLEKKIRLFADGGKGASKTAQASGRAPDGATTQFPGTMVDPKSGRTVSLSLFIGRSSGSTERWTLLDASLGSPMVLERGSMVECLQAFKDKNDYPKTGTIQLKIPSHLLCDPSTAPALQAFQNPFPGQEGGSLKRWAGYLRTVGSYAMVGALALASVATGPASIAVMSLMIGGVASGVAGAVLDHTDDADKGRFQFGSKKMMLDLAACTSDILSAGTIRWTRLMGMGMRAPMTGWRGAMYLSDMALGGSLLAFSGHQLLSAINAINARTDLSEDERGQMIRTLLVQAAQVGAMMLVPHAVQRSVLRAGRGRLRTCSSEIDARNLVNQAQAHSGFKLPDGFTVRFQKGKTNGRAEFVGKMVNGKPHGELIIGEHVNYADLLEELLHAQQFKANPQRFLKLQRALKTPTANRSDAQRQQDVLDALKLEIEAKEKILKVGNINHDLRDKLSIELAQYRVLYRKVQRDPAAARQIPRGFFGGGQIGDTLVDLPAFVPRPKPKEQRIPETYVGVHPNYRTREQRLDSEGVWKVEFQAHVPNPNGKEPLIRNLGYVSTAISTDKAKPFSPPSANFRFTFNDVIVKGDQYQMSALLWRRGIALIEQDTGRRVTETFAQLAADNQNIFNTLFVFYNQAMMAKWSDIDAWKVAVRDSPYGKSQIANGFSNFKPLFGEFRKGVEHTVTVKTMYETYCRSSKNHVTLAQFEQWLEPSVVKAGQITGMVPGMVLSLATR